MHPALNHNEPNLTKTKDQVLPNSHFIDPAITFKFKY